TMADMNINAPAGQATAMAPPVRTDDQILPWVPIGKSNCYLDLEISQSNPIYKIAVVLLKHTNFFRAFTASSTIPSNTHPAVLGYAFVPPPSSDVLINFVNELGYPKLVRNLSNVVTNDMFQPWRALTTIINLCLTGKTSGFERPRAPMLQILWGRRHRFHPRPDSLLYLPNEEHVLGYLKFSAKGTKREVFGMPIPGSLIIANIQKASYYQEYLAKVAQHRQYLAGETGSYPDSPALKPTKPARKPKSTAPKAPPRPSVSTPVTSAQPAPTFAPAKPQEKKRKQTTETSDKPSKAKNSKYGFVGKKRTMKSVAESVAEDAPAKEPQVAAEDADIEKALEEILKSMYDMPRGSLPPVVIREPESGKYQPLPEVMGKGKAKLDCEEESKKVMPGADAGGQGEGQAGPDPGALGEGQTGPDAGTQDEGRARSNPKEQSKGQARPDPGYARADEQSMPSPVVHAGLDREHMDLDVADRNLLAHQEPYLLFSDKPSDADVDKVNAETKVESMVSVTIHQDMSSILLMTSPIIDLTSRPESPKVHQQFKATATETTTTTTTTLPPPPAQQQSTAEAMMMKRIGELKHIMDNLIEENKGLEERLDSHGSCLYTLEQLDIPHQVNKDVSEVVTKAVDWAMQAPLRNHFRDLPKADMKESLHQRMWETESYKSHESRMQLYEALEKSMNRDHSQELAQDLAKARKKKKKSRESPNTPSGSPPHNPPPPPLPAGPSKALGAPGASGSF
nr:E-beta-farnesene synthase [Tanacetum cinerariifolium]